MERERALVCRCMLIGLALFGSSRLWGQEVDPDLLEPHRYALLIGVNEYREGQGLPRLAYAERDVDRLAERLESAAYFVTKLSLGAGRERATRIPTARNIRDAMERIIGNRNLSERDVVLVALAGHGVTVRVQESATDPIEEKFFFCPTDADLEPLIRRAQQQDFPTLREAQLEHGLISIDELYASLAEYDSTKGSGCRAGLKLILVDACRNDPSRMSGLRAAESQSLPPLPPPPGGLVTMFSCSEYEQAYEDLDLEHGVFFHYVIEGLGGKADLDQDRRVGVSELNQYVSRSVYDFVARHYDGVQNPELRGSLRGRAELLELGARTVSDSGSRARVPGELTAVDSLPGFHMVKIPAGRFRMGSPPSERGRAGDERQFEIELTDDFWLAETELTQAQWRDVMETEPWRGRANTRVGDQYPATWISWDEAVEFCRRLTERERAQGRLTLAESYVLPTVAQWEYACRAGTQSAYFWGESSRSIHLYAWYKGNAVNVGESFPHQVGLKQPNAWGLRDMSGNVCEWTADREGIRSPMILTNPEGPEAGTSRVHMGGSATSDAVRCRSAARRGSLPTYRDGYLGLRIARVSSARESESSEP